jgi:hypothetical protein
MTSAVADSLVRHEHKATDSLAAGLPPDAGPAAVLEAAHKGQYDLLTTDGTLAESPFQVSTPFVRTIVYLQLEGGDVEQDDAIDRLFNRYKRLTPGRLYTVTASRVKVRQLPVQKVHRRGAEDAE